MKKMISFAAIGLCSLVSQAGQPPGCGGFADYDVKKVSFKDAPLREAIAKITAGMPWQIEIDGGEDVMVSATDVSGPLSMVLGKLSAQAGFAYKQDRCVLQIKAEKAKPPKWRLTGGAPIHDQLVSWGNAAGWSVRWSVPVSWAVAADSEFGGDFPEAITKVIELLYAEGKPVRLMLWDGNRVAEVISSDVR